jgi:hypothetical protein
MINKTCVLYLFLTLLTLLVGCQKVLEEPSYERGKFNIEKEITEIIVLDWRNEEHITKITDHEFITKLINELSNANRSTAKVDIPNPDYKVILISGNQTVYEFGYYREAMQIGVIGRYWNIKEDCLYGVTLKLPIVE